MSWDSAWNRLLLAYLPSTMRSISSFARWLEERPAFLRSLKRAEIIYTADTAHNFKAAEREFLCRFPALTFAQFVSIPGYVTERVPRSMDRVLVTGDATQLARQQKDFARISGQTRDLTIYTSDSRGVAQERTIPGVTVAPSSEFAIDTSTPTASQEIAGYSIGR